METSNLNISSLCFFDFLHWKNIGNYFFYLKHHQLYTCIEGQDSEEPDQIWETANDREFHW